MNIEKQTEPTAEKTGTCEVCHAEDAVVEIQHTKQRLCQTCFIDGKAWKPGPPPLGNFVQYPGFFEIQRGSKAVGPGESETSWMVGCDPYRDGEPLSRVIWGIGPTLHAALCDWSINCLPHVARPRLFQPDPDGPRYPEEKRK